MEILNSKQNQIDNLINSVKAKLIEVNGSYLEIPILTLNPHYIFIAMEPSTGSKSSEQENEKSKNEKMNFINSKYDLILHYCAYKYLCKNNFDYYITDIAKAPLLVKKANDDNIERIKRWNSWADILLTELDIFGYKKENGAKIIAIGEKAYEFMICKNVRVDLCIPHYSWNNSNKIKKMFMSLNIDNNEFDLNNINNFIIQLFALLKINRTFIFKEDVSIKRLFFVYKDLLENI